jgi:hypothetical protein
MSKSNLTDVTLGVLSIFPLFISGVDRARSHYVFVVVPAAEGPFQGVGQNVIPVREPTLL